MLLRILFYAFLIVIALSAFGFFTSISPKRWDLDITPQYLNLSFENIEFKSRDGLLLRGWFIPQKNSRKSMIMAHGYPASKADILGIAPIFHDEFNILLFDFRRLGKSEGKFTTFGWEEQKDILGAIDYLKSRPEIDAEQIYAWGISCGAAAIIMATAQGAPIKTIIADSCYARLENLVDRFWSYFGPLKYPLILTTNLLGKIVLKVDVKEVQPLKAIEKIKVPIFIIHGEKDFTVSPNDAKELYEAAKSPKELWIIPDAIHVQGFNTDPQEYGRRVKEFLNKGKAI